MSRTSQECPNHRRETRLGTGPLNLIHSLYRWGCLTEPRYLLEGKIHKGKEALIEGGTLVLYFKKLLAGPRRDEQIYIGQDNSDRGFHPVGYVIKQCDKLNTLIPTHFNDSINLT